MCRKCMKQLYYIFRNQSAAGNVAQLIKKKEEKPVETYRNSCDRND